MRNAALGRYPIQGPLADNPSDWSDEAFGEELVRRTRGVAAETLLTGPSAE